MENGGRNNTYTTDDRTDYNGLEKKVNSISINIENSNSANNDAKISSMTKKISIKGNNNRKIDDKNEGKVNVINNIINIL